MLDVVHPITFEKKTKSYNIAKSKIASAVNSLYRKLKVFSNEGS